MEITFKDYFSFDAEIAILNDSESFGLKSAEQVTFIVLKILSYLTVVMPIICAFGLLGQGSEQNIVEGSSEEGGNELEDPHLPPVSKHSRDDGIAQDDPIMEVEEDVEVYSVSKSLFCSASDDYEIVEGQNWIQLNKTETPYHLAKFHISLDRRSGLYAEAIHKVLYYLIDNKIDTFKFQNPDLEDPHIDGTNQDGKEVCVYLNSDEKMRAHQIIFGIEEILKGIRIASGTPSRGDLPVQGCSYCYSRNSKNVFGVYLDADTLSHIGFTRKEACCISSDGLFPEEQIMDAFSGIPLDAEVVLDGLDSDDLKKIYDALMQDCFMPIPIGQITRAQFLITGNNRGYVEERCKPMLRVFFPTLGRLSNKEKPRSSWALEENLADSLFYHPVVIGIFNTAASWLAVEYRRRGITLDVVPGNILPGVYYGLLKPLAEEFDGQRSITEEQALGFIKKSSDRIIAHIVACGLRDRSQSQIGSDEPILLESR